MAMTPAAAKPVFTSLRAILRKHARTLAVSADTPHRYALEASVGPATISAWGGKQKKTMLLVAWVEIGKSYVSYHLMGLYTNAPLVAAMSSELRERMQGKTCFNFTTVDEPLFGELEKLTAASISAFVKAGFIKV
jgi:hypothetical protein